MDDYRDEWDCSGYYDGRIGADFAYGGDDGDDFYDDDPDPGK